MNLRCNNCGNKSLNYTAASSGESDSVKDFFIYLFAHPVVSQRGMRSPEFNNQNVDEVFYINDRVFIVKNIHSLVCDICGEKYFTPEIHKKTLKLINNKAKRLFKNK